MVNPGGFKGSRLAFLNDQNVLYAAAMVDNNGPAVLDGIIRRYFKRFPATLDHNEEPSAEWLAQVDDSAPDPEHQPPLEKDYATSGEYTQAMLAYDNLGRMIADRKAQIKRRVHYVYNKTRKDKATAAGKADNPTTLIAQKFLGASGLKKPRRKTAYNLWGPENRHVTDPVIKLRAQEQGTAKGQLLALRSAVYKDLFENLADEDKQHWIDLADADYAEALVQFNGKLNAPASVLPADRQHCIESMSSFVSPILDLLAEHTGWKISLIAGGPEPADGGRLNVMSIHSGVTPGSVKMNFGRSERSDYKKHVIPTFASFLKKCYTADDCRDRALPLDCPTATKIADLRVEEGGFDVHHLGPVRRTQPSSEEILLARSATNGANSSTPAAGPLKVGPPRGKKSTHTPAAVTAKPTEATASASSPPPGAPAVPRTSTEGTPPRAEVPDTSASSSPPLSQTDQPASPPSTASTPAQTAPSETAQTASVPNTTTPSETTPSTATSPPPPGAFVVPEVATGTTSSPPPSAEVASNATSSPPPPSDVTSPPPPPGAFVVPEVASNATGSPPPASNAMISPPPPSDVTSSPPPPGAEVASNATSSPPPPSDVTSPPPPPGAFVVPEVATGAEVASNATGSPPPASNATSSPPPASNATSSPPPPGAFVVPEVASGGELVATSAPPPPGAFVVPEVATGTTSSPPPGAEVASHATSSPPPASNATSSPPPPASNATSSPPPPSDVTSSPPPPGAFAVPGMTSSIPSASPPLPANTPTPPGSIAVPEHLAQTLPPPGSATVPDAIQPVAQAATSSRKRKAGGASSNSSDGASKQKKARTADDVAYAFKVTLPPDARDWVRNALAMLASTDFGGQWRELIAAWLRFEAAAGYADRKLPAKGRPKAVSDWIQRARIHHYRPDINIGTYAPAFNSWWQSLQPGSRHSGGPVDKGDTDWESLRCSGVNGLQ